jgi:hypothetical protein
MNVGRLWLFERKHYLTAVDRDLYKQRLEVLFKHYPSQHFDERPWGELSEVILVSHCHTVTRKILKLTIAGC